MSRQILKDYDGEWLLHFREGPFYPLSGNFMYFSNTGNFSPLADIDLKFDFELSCIKIMGGSPVLDYAHLNVKLRKLTTKQISQTLLLNIEIAIKLPYCNAFKYIPTQWNINVNEIKEVSFPEIHELLINQTMYDAMCRQRDVILKGRMIFHEAIPKSYSYTKCDRNTLVPNVLPNFIKNLKSVYFPSVLSDIVFEVGGKSFPAHKIILAAHSPVFMKMLTNDFLESRTNTVTITDATAEIFDQFLKYLYSCEIEDKSWASVKDLYYLAHKYDVEILRSECRNAAISLLSLDNACEILKVAYLYDDILLKAASKEFVVRNIKEITSRKDWKELTKTHLNIAYEVTVNFIPK